VKRNPRTTELVLLLAAAPAVLLVFALVHASRGASLTWVDFVVPAALLLAFVVAHLAIRLLAPYADPIILPVVALLTGLGLAFITRLDPQLAATQVIWVFVGVAALVATLAGVPSLERLARYKYTLMLVGVALLVLPMLPGIGHEVNGARLWLALGPVRFQPSELAKILIVLALAAYLADNRDVLSVSVRKVLGVGVPAMRHLGPVIVMWGISLLILIAMKDLGSSLLFFGIFLTMLYVATGRSAYVVVGLLLFAVGAYVSFRLFGHVQTRVDIWLHPFAEAAGKGYQLVQSLFSLAAGGLFGDGIGRGLPRRIPFVTTDFVYSAIGEELGLLGGAAMLIGYLTVVYRGLGIASRSRSEMAQLTAVGLTAALGLQVFVIVGGVTGLIPLTGITLPFVSYGGSSILANFILVALLLRAGDEAAKVGATVRDTKTAVMAGIASGRRSTRVAWLMTALFAALIANLTWVQVINAEALASNPFNTRRASQEMTADRGSIVTADGIVLARSKPAGRGTFAREYPQGTLAAHVVGYFTARYGRAGVEAAMNQTLLGKRNVQSVQDVIDSAAGLPVKGSDVVLTIDSATQRAAESVLQGRRGSVVALDPRTGAVLAMANAPAYSPGGVEKQWMQLSSDPRAAPLVNRATSALYPPGSTFKVVTLTGSLAAGTTTPSKVYPAPASIVIGGGKVTNFHGAGFGTATVTKATANSINTVFAQVATGLGASGLVGQADAFGFDNKLPFTLPTRTSRMTPAASMNEWETAWAGCGQPVSSTPGKPAAGPAATPLQMALVAAGVAEGGRVMEPYLVKDVTSSAGRSLMVVPTGGKVWRIGTDPATAATVRDLMVNAVANGSGRRASIPGVQVAGKTGTAEVSKALEPHAWFIGFAPAANPTVAVAVVFENAGVGGEEAAPAARRVMEAALTAGLRAR
jgi:cell division protein FtsI/penicillin-binding protein 2/cell division protein FtsW (lipid II flippase)